MGTKELRTIMGGIAGGDTFPTVKPSLLLRRMLRLAMGPRDRTTALDFFGGSGSLAAAVIAQNRADGGTRRFVLVEQSHHFDTTILPRLMRSMYHPVWNEGRPVDYPQAGLWWPEWVERTPRLVQVLRLEGYEDSLLNISLGEALPAPPTPLHPLHYHLPLPLSRERGLLDGEAFAHPFSSTLIRHCEQGTKETIIDVIETGNAWLGLHVESSQGETDPDSGRRYHAVRARRGGQRVLVLWWDGAEGGTAPPPEVAVTDDGTRVLTNLPCGADGVQDLAPLLRHWMEGDGGERTPLSGAEAP